MFTNDTLQAVTNRNAQIKSNLFYLYRVHLKFFLVLSLSFLASSMWAYKEPMKYGKIDKADLEMTVYPADTSAAAVVLCEYGYYNAAQHQFTHQIRIKILKEEGKSSGSFVVPAEEKTSVKGQVVNMENGSPVVTKLGKDGIFIERVAKNYFQARVALPNVKVGSIIDVEFFYTGFPTEWAFQKNIPVRWSELILEQSTYLTFKKNFSGFVPISEASDDRWVIKDAPAFTPEAYINSTENYITKFDFEIESVHFYGYYKDFATNWQAVSNTLNNDSEFGLKISDLNLFLNGLEKKIKSQTKDPYSLMQSAFQEMKAFKWNGKRSIWISDGGLEYAFSKKYGNSADINLSLLILLKKLGLNAYPVVLSTKDNGLLRKTSASVRKLNYVVVQVVINDKTFYLDATEEYLPVNILPQRALNEFGVLITKDAFFWADLTPAKNKSIHLMNLKLNPDGELSGDWTAIKSDYAAFIQRKEIKSFNSKDDYLKDVESSIPGLSVEDYECLNFDSIEKPVTEKFNIKLKNYASVINGQFFISPQIFDKYTINPFKTEDRQYPVDFTNPIETKNILILDIPEGYTIDQLPQNAKFSLPDNSASLQIRSIQISSTRLQIIQTLNINKPIYYQPEYKDLKAFFDNLVKKEAEMICIKKI